MTFDGETAPPATEAADAAFDQTLDQALSPGAPAKQPSPPAEPAAVTAKPDAAAPRDQQGRFTARTAAEELAPDVSTEPAKAPDAPVESTAEAEAQLHAEAEAEAAPELTYRYESDEVGIPGSAVGSDGGFIPTQALPEVLELVALGRSAREGTIRQRLSEAGEQLSRQSKLTEAARAEALHVISAIDEMIEKGTFGEWLENQSQNWAILKADARVKAKDLELEQERTQRQTYEQQQERARLEPQIRTALERTIAHYGQQAGLTPEAMEGLFNRLNAPRFRAQIVTQATADDPVRGVKRGEWLVDYGVVADEVEWVSKNGGAKQPAASRAEQLAADNARRTGKPSGAPPAVAAKGAPVPAPKTAIPQFKSAEEADEYLFDKGGYAKLSG
jgi:hypothetical protein